MLKKLFTIVIVEIGAIMVEVLVLMMMVEVLVLMMMMVIIFRLS